MSVYARARVYSQRDIVCVCGGWVGGGGGEREREREREHGHNWHSRKYVSGVGEQGNIRVIERMCVCDFVCVFERGMG